MRRWPAAAGLVLVAAGVCPEPALAHALTGRADLPVPRWLFIWAAGLVVLVSFVALALLWSSPRLGAARWRPLSWRADHVLSSRVLRVVCGATGLATLVLIIWSGLFGTQVVSDNLAPTAVYVIFWLGIVPVSLLFGNVFAAFSPWGAIGRSMEWLAGGRHGDALRPLRPYPEPLGRWPAACAIFLFAVFELVLIEGTTPEVIALAALVYTGYTTVAMMMFGVETWLERGEGFGVYAALLARISPFEHRDRGHGVQPPLVGLTRLPRAPGTVALLAVLIGATTFDGASEGALWGRIAPELLAAFGDAGLGDEAARQLADLTGLLAAIAGVGCIYLVGIAATRRFGIAADDLAGRFVHSLVPIAVAYVGAHYATLLLFQGQALLPLLSDPLGDGGDLLGFAGGQIDYTLIGATSTWYLQVALVVTGHIAALVLAHDRALELAGGGAGRSQLPMVAVMVGFTCLALWLLSQANA